MTDKELESLGVTKDELSAMITEVHKRMEAGTVRFGPEGMTPAIKEGLLKIRQHRDTGSVDLNSIDIDTALFIKLASKTFEWANQNKEEDEIDVDSKFVN
jgi:hypothetical protein